MANTSKQSPLGVNVLGSLLQNTGFNINPVAASYMGTSKTNSDYTFGSVVKDTILNTLTWAINDGYTREVLAESTYNNLISIGSNSIGALGNSKPPTYVAEDPTGSWTSAGTPATTGYAIDASPTSNGQSQRASWLPYNTTNPNKSITQWGWIRCHALQAWNEFNWNGLSVTQASPQYKDFCSSVLSIYGTMTALNQVIFAVDNSGTFLQGVYSNMDDLISADISGVNLATKDFGDDLINLGKALDLSTIQTFGLPSNLLKTIGRNSAITQDLSLALLAAGLTPSDVTNIISGKLDATDTQEQQIYGAFLIITGENLENVLAPLQCTTRGLVTLADLLNVAKMFPLSGESLTVPVYNSTGGSTNSKTYYPILDRGSLNAALTSPAIKNYIGSQLPGGNPITRESTLSPDNYNDLPIGFGSYLYGIIPADQAVMAGAFSYSMRQIRNIETVNFDRFAKVVKGIETTSDLTQVGGTDTPTDQSLYSYAKSQLALGSGPAGSYTMSDFLGCMTGLPYPWKLIQKRIQELQTTRLQNIYNELFLATTWESGEASAVQLTPAYSGPGQYTITGLVFDNVGGGYGRGTAPNPTVTLTLGGSSFTTTAVVGKDISDIGSNGDGTYGRLISIEPITVTINSDPAGFIIEIESPPVATLPVSASGNPSTSGANTPAGTDGWATMSNVVQSYIDQANQEILDIQTNNPIVSNHLNTYWNILGSQLMIEQRARFNNLTAVPIPYDSTLNSSPLTLSSFVDSIYSMAQDTRPHMSAQSMEAISDLCTPGGQSVVGLMRQERNQARLQLLGIEQDNNIPDKLSDSKSKLVTANGTIGDAVIGIESPNGNTYTVPAWPENGCNNQSTFTPIPLGEYLPSVGFQQKPNIIPGDVTPILNGELNPVVNPYVPVGPTVQTPKGIVIIKPPAEYDPSNLPFNVDPNYTSSTLIPSSPRVPDALAQVITCNCDCWMG